MKTLIAIVSTVFSLAIGFSQTNYLKKNINLRAKELKHGLNSSQDSLILDCACTIFKVEIFNDDFSKTLEIGKYSATIALDNLPMGRFIIEAVLKDKRVIMNLLREHDKIETNKELSKPLSQSENETTLKVKKSTSDRLGQSNKPVISPRIPKSYWVEYIISNGSSSYKTLRFANKTMVDKMVAKNKIEVKTVRGKLNHLTIWEIYDTTKFLRFKRRNPDFSKSSKSEFFNVIPYYDSKNHMAKL